MYSHVKTNISSNFRHSDMNIPAEWAIKLLKHVQL